MFKTSMLSLPMVLLGASCVPPAAGLETSARAAMSYPAAAAGEARPAVASVNPMLAHMPLEKDIIEVGPAAKPFDIEGQDEEGVSRSLDCLATAIYYEARSETGAGQLAVAQVVLNRVRHPAFPNSICGVVYQGSARSTGCQFSFTCDGSTRRGPEPSAWARARKIAQAALDGRVAAEVGLATHYHTTAILPWWAPSLRRVVTVGSHIFYRWRGAGGQQLALRQRQVLDRPQTRDELTAVRTDGAALSTKLAAAANVVVHRRRNVSPGDNPQAAASLVKVHRTSGVETVSVSSADAAAADPDAGDATTRWWGLKSSRSRT